MDFSRSLIYSIFSADNQPDKDLEEALMMNLNMKHWQVYVWTNLLPQH